MPDAQDGRYAYDRPWSLTAERLATQRTWDQASPPWHPPVVPTVNPYDMIPPKYGYRPWADQLGIEDVLNGVFSRLQSHAHDAMPTDFSGQIGSIGSSMRPTGAGGGGIV